MSRAKILLFVLLIFAAMFASPVAGSDTTPTTECPPDTGVQRVAPTVNATVTQPQNRSDIVRVTYNASDTSVIQFEPPAHATVINTSGFAYNRHADLYVDTDADNPVIEYQIGTYENYTYANRSDWTFAPLPTGHSNPTSTVIANGTGIAGQSFVYLGDYERYRRVVDCQEIVLVVADDAQPLEPEPDRVLDRLEYVSQALDTDHRPATTTVFVTNGQVAGPHQGLANGADAWVGAGASENLEVPIEVYIHEYVHTRQVYGESGIEEFHWINEGITQFLTHQMLLATGEINTFDYNDRLKEGSTWNASLSNTSTWSSKRVLYSRGSAFIALLNHRILDASNGSHRIRDVVRRLNQLPESPSRSEFLRVVEDVSDDETREWAADAMTTTESYEYRHAERSPTMFDLLVRAVLVVVAALVSGVILEARSSDQK